MADGIRRKLASAAARNAPDESGGTGAGHSGADRAWRLALARAARDAMDLRLDVTEQRISRVSLAEVLELPPNRALIVLLEGPRDGLGVLMLAPELLSGLIEAQTLCRVMAAPAPPRKPTRTDAAMVAAVLDLALQGLETALEESPDLTWTDGFRYASFLDDARPLGLLLEDVTYRLIRSEIALAGGAKAGGMLLALPAEGRGRRPHYHVPAPSDADEDISFADALGSVVMAAGVVLDAAVGRVTLPLAQVLALTVGQVLPLPRAALDQIDLDGSDGRRVAGGKLGQHRGMRAVRVTAPAVAGAETAADAAGWGGVAPVGAAAPLMPGAVAAYVPDVLRPTGTG